MPGRRERHCTEAGLTEKGASLWGKAGQRSLERSALVEAGVLLFSVLYSVWLANYIAFHGDVMCELARQFLAFAEKQGAGLRSIAPPDRPVRQMAGRPQEVRAVPALNRRGSG